MNTPTDTRGGVRAVAVMCRDCNSTVKGPLASRYVRWTNEEIDPLTWEIRQGGPPMTYEREGA